MSSGSVQRSDLSAAGKRSWVLPGRLNWLHEWVLERSMMRVIHDGVGELVRTSSEPERFKVEPRIATNEWECKRIKDSGLLPTEPDNLAFLSGYEGVPTAE